MAVTKEKIKEILFILPKLNCGLCGFGNCGQFARAVAEGKASPFGCRQNPWSGYRISEIIGARVPAYSYGYQPVFVSRPGVSSSQQALREEVRGLSQSVDDILARIEKLKARR
ncbi:hypothetical protein ES703_22695 [subsurface metagenome]